MQPAVTTNRTSPSRKDWNYNEPVDEKKNRTLTGSVP